MAKNGISEDKIKYVIDVETKEAQQHIYQMNEKLNELTISHRNLDKAMIELEAQGKKGNANYNELKSQKAKLAKEIKGLKQEIKEETAQLNTQALSMSQLRKRAKELQRELNEVVPAMHPERYEELAGRLNEVNARMAELKEKTEEFKREVQNDTGEDFFWSSVRLRIWDYAKNLVSDVISKVRELATESLDLAISADGVTKAFNDLNNPGILDELRAATKGTVNDFELMKATVQAKDFRIPLEDLGKYLQFAQLKAQQTGQSVDYMTNSIITGLGRQSTLILDNLGISAAEINEQIAKTGDFMKAVGVIVNEQLSAAGEGYVSMADKIAQKNTELQNAQLKLGQSLIPYKETFDEIFGGAELQIIKLLAVVLKYDGVIKSLTVAIGIFTVASIACNKALWTTIANTNAATKAMAALNLVLKTNIWVALASAIIGVVSYLTIFRKKTDESKKAMEEIAQTEKELSSSINDQTAKVKKLNAEMRNEKLSLDRRRAALEELKRIIPEYNGLLSKEGQLTRDNKEAIDAYIESLSKQIKLKAYEDKLTALYKQKSDLEDQRDETSRQYWDTKQTNTIQGSDKSLGGRIVKFLGLDSESKLEKSLTSINSSISTTDEKITMLENKIKDLGDISLKTTESATVPGSSAAGQDSSRAGQGSSRARGVSRESQNPDTAAINDLNTRHQASIQAWQEYYNKKKSMLEEDCISEKITKEKYNELMLGLDQLNTAAIITIEQAYYNESQSLQLTDNEKKQELINSYAQYVKTAEENSNRARLNAMKAYYDNLNKIQQTSAEEQNLTLEQQRDAELKIIDAYCQAGIEYARQFGQSEVDITEATESAKAAIIKKYADLELQQTKEKEDKKRQAREQLGIDTMTEYERQKQMLDEALKNQYISQEEYEKKVQKLKKESFMKQAQYYTTLFSNAFTALQDAEMAQVDAKYDAQIEAARQAGEDTTELENKKAQEKLAIEKKYADVNFAIKASQIIADTAVSIMMAYSQLGPIAGSIAAALMGITGAAQLAAANAERERVKKMTLSGSSSSTASGARVATGLESGGRIDVERRQDGKLFNAELDPDRRGYIDRPTVIVGEGPTGQSKEWVASNAALSNPTIAPIIDIIDNAQRAGTVRTLDMRKLVARSLSGLQSGGPLAPPSPISAQQPPFPAISSPGTPTSPADQSLLKNLTTLLTSLQEKGIPAFVALDDFDAQQKIRQKSRKIGSKP